MSWQDYLDGWDKRSPAPEGLWNPDPNVHHSYCAYYRDGYKCSCFEGRFPSGPEGDAAIESYHAEAKR